MSKVIKIQNLDLLGLSLLESNLPYTTGERAKAKKHFNRYAYQGKVFTVDTDHPFCKSYAEKEVGYVELTPQTYTNDAGDTIESWNFSGAYATHKAKLEILTYAREEKKLTMWNLSEEEVTDETVEEMTKGD